jgi:hypothetical protein
MRHEPSPLTVLPGNQPSVGSRYACLIVIKDYVRLGPESRASGAWHYTQIEPEILADVRDGRAILVFDLSNEGPAYDPSLFDPLYAWIEQHRLPAGRCIWLAQNRLMGVAAVNHVGPRSALIHFAHYDYFVKLIAWRFSQAGTTSTPGMDLSAYLEHLLEPNRKDKLLLCLNATPRLSRTLTVAALHHHFLLYRSLVSFPGLNYVKSGASLSEVLHFLDHNPRLDYLRPWVQAVSRMSPLRVDQFPEQGNALVEKIDRGVYQRTYLSLVTESDFCEKGIARVTEKTVKAFCMGHPTLILGNAHSIDIVRSFGFRDWTDVLDRGGDSVIDPAARFESVVAEVLRQTQRIKDDPRAWMTAVRDVSIHNHQHAVSGAFLAHYVNFFDRSLVDHMSKLVAA